MTRPAYAPTLVLLAALLLVGCGGANASPAPTNSSGPSAAPSPAPSPTQPVSQVATPAQAAALVFASQDISRMGPLQTDVNGQSAWYNASEDTTGFKVTITVGSGDCQSGCIEQHTWTYHVDYDATVTLIGDEGDDIGLPSATGTADPVTLRVRLVSGPICPVVRNPPNSACAPRPVANTEIDVFDVSGTLVGSGVSGVDGVITAQLPPGAYYVIGIAVDGMMREPESVAFAAVGGDSIGLTLTYDTGIR